MEKNKNEYHGYCECCDNHYDDRGGFRITKEYIYDLLDGSDIIVDTVFDKCTVVSCKLPSGFVIVESSPCLDPKNYDEEIGYECCMDKIVDKLYELEGYLLNEALDFDDYEDEEDEDDLSDDYERANYDYEAKYHSFNPMDDFDYYEVYHCHNRK